MTSGRAFLRLLSLWIAIQAEHRAAARTVTERDERALLKVFKYSTRPAPVQDCSHFGGAPPKATGRFAIEVSGGLRSFLTTAWSFEQLVLGANPPDSVDVFWHLWVNSSLPLHRECLRVIRAWPQTRAVVTEEFADRAEVMQRERATTPFRSQHRKIRLAHELADAHSRATGARYDAIVRTRPDLVYHGALDLGEFHRSYARAAAGGHYFVVPNCAHGIDMFAVGTTRAMAAFAAPIRADDRSAGDAFVWQRLLEYGVVMFEDGARHGGAFGPWHEDCYARDKRHAQIEAAHVGGGGARPVCGRLFFMRRLIDKGGAEAEGTFAGVSGKITKAAKSLESTRGLWCATGAKITECSAADAASCTCRQMERAPGWQSKGTRSCAGLCAPVNTTQVQAHASRYTALAKDECRNPPASIIPC